MSNSIDINALQATPKPRVQRVMFLSLPTVMEEGSEESYDRRSFHLGLMYIAAVTRSAGYEVTYLDCFAEAFEQVRPNSQPGWPEYGLTDEEIVERVVGFQPDLLAITLPFSCQHYLGHVIVGMIKNIMPSLIVVTGGNHVTAVPGQIDRSIFDYLIMGEGELAFISLLQSINENATSAKIPGVIGPHDLTCVPQQYITNLDLLPIPALDLLPLEKLWGKGKRWIMMIATRGCTFDCNFCSIHTIMGYSIRRRSISNVVAEIDHWKNLYNIQEIYFEDDNLTTQKKWAKELFRQIAERKFGLRLYARNGIRADTVDLEMLQLMKAAGFHDFTVAPESGRQETLDHIIGKKMKLVDVDNAIQLAKQVNLGVVAFLIIGFPGETWEDIYQTVTYAQKLKRFGASGIGIANACPYPGTRLYLQCVAENLLLEPFDYRKCRTYNYQINNPYYTAEELKAYRERTMQELIDPHTPLITARNALHLLFTDLPHFIRKLRYKLNFSIRLYRNRGRTL